MNRKDKRISNRLFKKLKINGYFIDCNYHVCKVTEKTFWDVDGISLFDNGGTSCSFHHCGPVPITEAQANEILEYVKTHSWNDYLKKYQGYTEEDLIHFEEMDKVWNFRKYVRA